MSHLAFPITSVMLFFHLKLCAWSVNERKVEEREDDEDPER